MARKARRGKPGDWRRARGQQLRGQLADRWGRCCFYCRTPFGEELAGSTLDHYLPYAWWRCHRAWNLVLACEPCNQAKGDTLPWPLVWLLLDLAARRQAQRIAA